MERLPVWSVQGPAILQLQVGQPAPCGRKPAAPLGPMSGRCLFAPGDVHPGCGCSSAYFVLVVRSPGCPEAPPPRAGDADSGPQYPQLPPHHPDPASQRDGWPSPAVGASRKPRVIGRRLLGSRTRKLLTMCYEGSQKRAYVNFNRGKRMRRSTTSHITTTDHQCIQYVKHPHFNTMNTAAFSLDQPRPKEGHSSLRSAEG